MIKKNVKKNLPPHIAKHRYWLFVLFVLSFSTCNNIFASKVGWKDLGLEIIPIREIHGPDTSNTIDTIQIKIWSQEVYDASTFSRFDIAKDTSQIEITAWANVRKWIGTMPVPPTDLWPLSGDRGDCCKIPPPFHPGRLIIIFRQPDSTVLCDTIIIKP